LGIIEAFADDFSSCFGRTFLVPVHIMCIYIYAQLSLSVACFCRELGYPKFARFALMSDWLVVWNILNFIFFHILGIIIPTD
jgi:hypothetical protein